MLVHYPWGSGLISVGTTLLQTSECPDDFLNRLTQLRSVGKWHRIAKVPLCAHLFTAKSLGYVAKAHKTLTLAQTIVSQA